jgi:tRNA(Ile)-lysidine synthase
MKAWSIFYGNILKNDFIKPKDKIVLAVSGGMDSMCMLHMFWRLAKKINIYLLVVNFNHGLRNTSMKETKIVKNFSDKLGISCLLETIDVQKYCKKKSVSIETASRVLRYSVLEQIAQKHKYNKIATAHHANDNAETVLMWLLRGSGNFIGIPQKRKVDKNLTVIRPLLPIKRKLIEDYVKYHEFSFCHDTSNFSDIFTRNKVRLSLIPICEKINPMAIEHIFSLSCIQARERAYLEEISSKYSKKCIEVQKNRILLDLTRFLRYNVAVRFRILKNILPQKRYSLHINLLMQKILSLDAPTYRLSADWVFKIKSNKAYFIRNGK